MDIQKITKQGVHVLAIQGHLDTRTSDEFQTALLDEIDNGARQLVIDCTDLSYISSSGLRALMVGVRRLKPIGGRLGLCTLRPHLADSLQISGILELFSVFDTVDDAVKALS